MIATASLLAAGVQVATAGAAEAGCIWVGTECIEEVVVTPPPTGGGDEPRDNPGDDNGGGGGDGGYVLDPTGHYSCYVYQGQCIENVIVFAPYNANVVVHAPWQTHWGQGDPSRPNSVIANLNVTAFNQPPYRAPGQDTLAAIGLTIALLNDPDCNSVVTGNNPPVFYTSGNGTVFYEDAYFIASKTYFLDLNDPSPYFADVAAQRAGAGQTVRIHELFHAPILWDVDFLGGRPPVRTPTQTELQAHVLLHEIGHLTGATVHASNGAHAAVDARITESCFKDFNY